MSFAALYIPVAAAYALALSFFLVRKRGVFWPLLTAFLLQAGYLTLRSLRFGFFNPGGILEESVFLPFCLTGITLWIWRSRSEEDARPLVPAAALFALTYLFLPKGLIPPSAKSPSLFSPLFFFFEILAHALFIAAAVLAGRSLRREETFEPAHRLAVWGFLAYSIAQVTGAIWCYLGWSVPFQWGLRHLHSAAIWCTYVNYLHLRYIPWWTSRRKGWYLVAAALLLLAYLVVLQWGESRQLRIGG